MSRQADSQLRGASEREPRPSKNGLVQAEWRGYVNVSLSAQQKADYDAWAHTEDVWLALAEAVQGGSQLGLKFVPGEGTFLASLTQRTAGHVNGGLCVTARSTTADKALWRVLFLYRVLGSEGPWEAVQGMADPDRW